MENLEDMLEKLVHKGIIDIEFKKKGIKKRKEIFNSIR